jgi:hypothetical protein
MQLPHLVVHAGSFVVELLVALEIEEVGYA